MSTVVLDALHEYGAFMTDTNGESATVDLRNIPGSPTSKRDLRTLPPQFWLRHLHVVARCVTTRRC